MGRGWKALIDRVDVATTFDELQQAGDQFGKVMGANTARIMVMLTMAVLGELAGPLVKPKTGFNLPQAAQASRFATKEGAVALAAVGGVEVVTIAESSLTLTLAPGVMAMSSTGRNTGGGSPGGRRPSREERLAELAKDPDHNGQVKPASEREGAVALDLEEQGKLKEFVRRAKRSEGHSGDFTDGNEQDWDVKQPHSRAQLEEIRRLEAVREGRPPPKFDPKKRLKGEFDLNELLGKIHEEFAKGENVIIDTIKLNEADLAALRRALTEEGVLGTKVLFYP